MKILQIITSPNLKSQVGSLSEKISNNIVKKYSDATIEKLILDEDKYFEETLNAKSFSSFFDERSNKLIEQLNEVDLIVISTPTINFGIPSVLKNYFDRVLQAGKTFKYKYDNGKGGSVGLLKPNKKVLIINTQGSPSSWYPFTSTIEQIKGSFNFIGINDINSLVIDGTKTPEFINKTHEEIIELNKEKIENFN